ncbi:MAG: hypothetical protein KAJ51_17190 [Thermoplasmata archaeon]|nr:hypothetical protein [Thermoplasmata archaeon]
MTKHVGIGTTNPTHKLQVEGSGLIRPSSGVYIQTTTSGTTIYGATHITGATAITGAVAIAGAVGIVGSLGTVGPKWFVIDHPLDPKNKTLTHASVESPDTKTLYDGTVVLDENDNASVELPTYFEALNKDFRYQLTCIGEHADVYISQEVTNNTFKIAGGESGMKISWQVTGIRHDKSAEDNPLVVVQDKE